MRYARDSDVVYRSGFLVALVALITPLWILAAVGAAISGNEQAVVGVVIFVTVGPLISIVHLRVRVVLRNDEVVLYDTFKRKAVRYEEIDEVRRVRSGYGGRTLEIIHYSDGWILTRLPSYMTGHAAITSWHHKLAAEITLRADSARSDAYRESRPLGPGR